MTWSIILFVFLLQGVAIGFFVGRYVNHTSEKTELKMSMQAHARDDRFDSRNIIASMKADAIERNLR